MFCVVSMGQVSCDENIQLIFCNSHFRSNGEAPVNIDCLSLIIIQCGLFVFR